MLKVATKPKQSFMSQVGSHVSNTEDDSLVFLLFVFYIFYRILVSMVVTLKSTNFITYIYACIHAYILNQSEWKMYT